MPRISCLLLTTTLAFFALPAAAQSYKCKGADGRIEYSDRACSTDKDVLNQPKSAATAPKPLVAPMQQLEAVFKEYESRLCERERLASEIDIANRSGDLARNAAAWKPKQDHLSNMNDTLIEFQGKVGKITRAAGFDSDESAAVRKFQNKLKDCAKITAAK